MANHVSKEMNRYNYLVSEIDSVYHEAALRLGLSDSALNILYAICDNGEGCLLQDISFYTGMSIIILIQRKKVLQRLLSPSREAGLQVQ